MVFTNYFIAQQHATDEMPIHSCNASPTYDAIWTFTPHEIVDFSKFTMITSLIIECYGPDQEDPPTKRSPWCLLGTHLPEHSIRCSGHLDLLSCLSASNIIDQEDTGPFTLPSLNNLFPLLRKLLIKNTYPNHSSPVYLKSLTDLPSGLHQLEINNTMIEDIGFIISNFCPNIMILTLNNNRFPIKLTSMPPNLETFQCIHETITDDIHLQEFTSAITIIHSTISYVYIHPSVIQNHNPDALPVFLKVERIIVAGCKSPYDEQILANPKNEFGTKAQHIVNTNKYRYYLQFGSIPSRILIKPEEEEVCRENPIIVALHLASNYPRRMAEFMTYI